MAKHDIKELFVTSDNGVGIEHGEIPGGRYQVHQGVDIKHRYQCTRSMQKDLLLATIFVT